jgi:hypothetical protein
LCSDPNCACHCEHDTCHLDRRDIANDGAHVKGASAKRPASFRFHIEFAAAISLMQKRLIDVKPLISEPVSLGDARPASSWRATGRAP